jgi:hypothetical protein
MSTITRKQSSICQRLPANNHQYVNDYPQTIIKQFLGVRDTHPVKVESKELTGYR